MIAAAALIACLIWYIQSMREFIIYMDNDGQWVAECQEIPGYRAKAASKEEAIQKIKSALLIYHPCKCED